MNTVHLSIIKYVREQNSARFEGQTDEQVVRMMFQNFRGRDTTARGLRLTNFGKEIMQSYFQSYEIAAYEGKKPGDLELVYLDRRAKLPYHISENGTVVMFDPELGIKLTLIDGDIKSLSEMDV